MDGVDGHPSPAHGASCGPWAHLALCGHAGLGLSSYLVSASLVPSVSSETSAMLRDHHHPVDILSPFWSPLCCLPAAHLFSP